MTALIFNQQLAIDLFNSKEEFPIDLDDAWVWLGYSEKSKAKNTLIENFEEGLDFSLRGAKSSTGGRSSELIMLTYDCLKSLGMMAKTKQGKQVRRYFLNCEATLKEMVGDSRKFVRANELMVNIEEELDELKEDFPGFYYGLLSRLGLAKTTDLENIAMAKYKENFKAIYELQGQRIKTLNILKNLEQYIIEQQKLVTKEGKYQKTGWYELEQVKDRVLEFLKDNPVN